MQSYRYKVVDAGGKAHTGVMSAKSEAEAAMFLRERNQIPVKIEREGPKSFSSSDISFASKKVKTVDLVVFCRQLSSMLKAGLPLDRALSTQIGQTEKLPMKEALTKMSAQIKQGMPMSRAMSEQPRAFPQILARSVEAGEKTGNMDEALARMAVHFDKENTMKRKVGGAMVYPLVCLSVTIAVAVGMIIFVFPTFAEMFASVGSSLPPLTQFFMDLSDSLRTRWYFHVLGVIVGVYLIMRWLSTPVGRNTFDGLKLRMPIIKKIMIQILTARFTRTLSTMLSSGITILDSIQIAAESMNNKMVEGKVLKVLEEIKTGASISAQLRNVAVFPEMMLTMLAVGEETGEMDEMLARTADYYDDEYDSAIAKLLSLIEPALIVLMAGVIGTIVVAMYLPMFDIYAVM